MRKQNANLYRSQMKKTFFSLIRRDQGQALVEFTLIFILLVAVSWIPAEFGLAFYSGQMALNASREGARLAAASRTLAVADTDEIATQTCKRLSSAILIDGSPTCAPYSNANVQVTPIQESTGCMITVTVRGDYNFRFYQLLQLLPGSSTVPPYVRITRETKMLSEWVTSCP